MDRERQQRRDVPGSAAVRSIGLTVAAEAAAGDQREPLDALRELVEELHRHAAAERVPDDRRALDADRGEQVADARRVRAERVVAARRRGVAVADEVGRDDRVRRRERLRDAAASGSRS